MRPVIIVSGASSSLGTVLCESLVNSGFKVYAGYNLHGDKFQKSNFLIPTELDITNTQSLQKTIQTIIKKEKTIQGLINLVAISPSGESLGFDIQDFQKILDINTIGPFRLIKEVLPILPTGGKIINIGSLSGLISFPRFGLYSASKFALRAMSLSLYHEWLSKKRYVVHIAPGAIAKYPSVPAPFGSARNRLPLLNWLFPLTSPHYVSKIIVNCIKNPSPPAEILIGADTLILALIRRLTPEFLWNYIQALVWKKQQ